MHHQVQKLGNLGLKGLGLDGGIGSGHLKLAGILRENPGITGRNTRSSSKVNPPEWRGGMASRPGASDGAKAAAQAREWTGAGSRRPISPNHAHTPLQIVGG